MPRALAADRQQARARREETTFGECKGMDGEGGEWEAERGAERRALCVAIDEELRAFLRCVDNYQTATREVVSACKAGLFDMARARKSMGMGGCAVSQLQYPARMKASGVSWNGMPGE